LGPTLASRLVALLKPLGVGGAPRMGLRLAVVGTIALACGLALVVRLWYLQVISQQAFKAQVEYTVVKDALVPPERGLILDREGNLLVGNQVVEEILVNRSLLGKRERQVVSNLAYLLGEDPSSIKRALSNPNYNYYQPVPVAVGVDPQAVIYIKEHPDLFPAVTVSQTYTRTYPQGDVLAQTLGWVGQITASMLKEPQFRSYPPSAQVGRAGLEASFEQYLQGAPGAVEYVVNSLGQVVSEVSTRPARPGDSLVTTIDLPLQQVLESALAAQIQADRQHYDSVDHQYPPAPGGAAIVMDVTNGDVLAMASYPSYDPSVWVGGISTANYERLTSPQSGYPLLNRVIDGLYTPGSVFKLATATAALADGLITPSYTYDDATGYFTIPNCRGMCSFHDADSEALGVVNVTKALAASDDVFFYNLGYQFYVHRAQYGIDAIQRVAQAYGFGEKTGVPLPGEAAGRVDSPEVRKRYKFLSQGWYPGDQIEMAFGQGGTLITPIQLAVAYATFANGGTRYQPQLVKWVVDPQGHVVRSFPPVVQGHVVVPPAARQAMLQGFIQAVSAPYGTVGATGLFSGFPLQSYPIAGKTGTASVGPGKVPNAAFVAFGPANDPKYVVAVMIEQAGYGAVAAAPVALKVFQYLVSHPVPPAKVVAPDTLVNQVR
jgi:penicillin-binding protein 2